MSRKLDARVAEKLMGMEILKDTRVDNTDYHYTIGIDKYRRVPPYSTDMNTAMELLDTYEKYQITKGKYVYKVFIYTEDWITSSDESLPIAICLAALRAKGDGKWVDEYLKELI